MKTFVSLKISQYSMKLKRMKLRCIQKCANFWATL